jgi:hypothetical protein
VFAFLIVRKGWVTHHCKYIPHFSLSRVETFQLCPPTRKERKTLWLSEMNRSGKVGFNRYKADDIFYFHSEYIRFLEYSVIFFKLESIYVACRHFISPSGGLSPSVTRLKPAPCINICPRFCVRLFPCCGINAPHKVISSVGVWIWKLVKQAVAKAWLEF